MSHYKQDMQTKAVHAGEPIPRKDGAVSFPVYQSAMFLYDGEKDYHDLKYIRLNNTPNHDALAQKVAALENGEAALITASGMAAITTTILTVLGKQGHLLAQNSLYGGTYDFLTADFDDFGLSYSFFDATSDGDWQELLKAETKAIYVESITNPTMQVADLKKVVEFAQKNNLISIIDNTFASPVNFNPLDLGFDIVVHSATKYLNGHSDMVAGCVISSKELIAKITHKLNHYGGSLDPHACFLLQRGLKTLVLRVKQQNENALKLAQFLEKHPDVKYVNYPGLESNQYHARAKYLFRGYGGMLSFEIDGGQEIVNQFLQNLTIPLLAPSLGGLETLAVLPSLSSHAGMSKETRKKIGISDTLVRISVGIEAINDLIADFKQALANL